MESSTTETVGKGKLQQQVEKDLPFCLELFSNINKSCKDFSTHLKQILESMTGEKKTEGMSLVTLKTQVLLSMMVNQTKLMLMKSQGQPIEGNPAIHRLLELRTTMEKIQPLEAKVRFQTDSLLKEAKAQLTDKEGMKFKADIQGVMRKDADSEDSDDEDKEKGEKPNKAKKDEKYRPPKLRAVPYEFESIKEKQEKQKETARMRALNRSIVREYAEQYLDAPEEQDLDLHPNKRFLEKKLRERQEYEETNLKRISVTRKEKNEMKRMRSGLEGITNFGDISALDLGEDDIYEPGPKSKKRKTSKKHGKGHKRGSAGRKKRR